MSVGVRHCLLDAIIVSCTAAVNTANFVCCCRYQIQYTVSDADHVAAKPITINITFVEVAVVTGSFLLISQAPGLSIAQQHAQELNATGAAANSVLTAAVATVFQAELTSATSNYVHQLTSSLGASAATVAASNTLQLGLFGSVAVPDVTVLNATIDQTISAVLNTTSSGATPIYAFNVTLQVAVLTADLLLSVFVDVLNSTVARRRLLGKPSLTAARLLPLLKQQLPQEDALLPELLACESAASQTSSCKVAEQGPLWTDQLGQLQPETCQEQDGPASPAGLLVQPHTTSLAGTQHVPPIKCSQCQQDISTETKPCCAKPADLASSEAQHAKRTPSILTHSAGGPVKEPHAAARGQADTDKSASVRHLLQSTSSDTAFPLVSLLQFKMSLVIAAFTDTSGCSTDSLTDLFYQDEDPPDALDALCAGANTAADHSLNMALLARSNSTVPVLQVSESPACTDHASA